MHLHHSEKEKTLGWIVLLNVFITVVEIIAGVLAGSLALLSDAMHNLSDVAAVGLSFWAKKVAHRESTERHTYGYQRVEILTAFVNALLLMGVTLLVGREAIGRFLSPLVVQGHIMVVVGLFAFLANGISAFLLHHDAKESLNMRSSYLHLFSDAVFSLVVVIGGMVVWWKPLFWVDPVLSLLLALWIVKEAWEMMRRAVDILMQAAAPLDYDFLRVAIENVPGVKNIHHVHTWRSDEKTIYFEAHIEMEDQPLSRACEVGEAVERRLKDFGITHVTLQYETDRCREKTFYGKE